MIQKKNHGDMRIVLEVWRQSAPGAPGAFEEHEVMANEHMSFLELLDVLNEQLVESGQEPFVFEHDCREGICGSCAMTIAPRPASSTCASTATETASGSSPGAPTRSRWSRT